MLNSDWKSQESCQVRPIYQDHVCVGMAFKLEHALYITQRTNRKKKERSHTAANVAGKKINDMPATVFMEVLSSLVSAAMALDSLAIDTLVSLSC